MLRVILGRFILNPPKTSLSALALANQPLGRKRERERERETDREGREQVLNKQGKNSALVDSPNIGLAAGRKEGGRESRTNERTVNAQRTD